MNMIRISRMIGLSGLSNRCSRSIQMVPSGIGSSLKKFGYLTRPTYIRLICPMLPFTVIDLRDEIEDEEAETESTVLSPVQESCNNFLSSILNFLTTIFDAIIDSTLQYKIALNELCLCLEKYETSKAFTINSEFEDAIIAARAKVYDCKKKYMKLMTVMQGIEKVVGAIGELSFLLGEETMTVVLKSTLQSVSEKMLQDSTEIKHIQHKLNNYENALLLNAQINNYENNDDNDDNRNSDDGTNNDNTEFTGTEIKSMNLEIHSRDWYLLPIKSFDCLYE